MGCGRGKTISARPAVSPENGGEAWFGREQLRERADHNTLPLARQVGPAGKVRAFEPDPLNFGLLERNVAVKVVEGPIRDTIREKVLLTILKHRVISQL